LDAIGMISESPLGYYELLDVYCTTTPSVSPNNILQIYDSSNSVMTPNHTIALIPTIDR